MPHKGKGRRSLTGAGDWEGHMQHRILPIDPLMQSLENQLFPAILKLPGMKRTFPVAVTGKTLKKNLDILGVASPEVIAAMRAGTLKTLNLTGKQLTKMVKEVSKRTTKLPAKPSTKPPPLKLPGSFSKMLSSAKPKSNVVPLRTRPGLQKEWSEMGKGVTRPSDVRGNPSIAGVEKSKPNVVPLPRSQNAKVKDSSKAFFYRKGTKLRYRKTKKTR